MRRHSLRLQTLSAIVGADPNALLATTAQLLRTRGYELTTTYEIAEQAGVAAAVQDHRFPSKDDIMAALLEQTIRPLLPVSEAMASRIEPPEVRLWALCHAHTRCHLTNPLIRALLRSVLPNSGELAGLDAETAGSQVADAALRIAGCSEAAIAAARSAGADLLAELEQPS